MRGTLKPSIRLKRRQGRYSFCSNSGLEAGFHGQPVKISRCYEILDLPVDATMKDLKDAYRDAMSVWHPDRFSVNPRLKHKAEEKAAQINLAYEILSAHFKRDQVRRNSASGRPADETLRGGDQAAGRIEKFAETGTMAVLQLGHAVYSALRKYSSSK